MQMQKDNKQLRDIFKATNRCNGVNTNELHKVTSQCGGKERCSFVPGRLAHCGIQKIEFKWLFFKC